LYTIFQVFWIHTIDLHLLTEKYLLKALKFHAYVFKRGASRLHKRVAHTFCQSTEESKFLNNMRMGK